MIAKLIPIQISKLWDVIKYAVEHSLPPTVDESPNKMQHILAAALSGYVDVWVTFRRNDKGLIIEGVVLTKPCYDEISGTRSLLVYSAFNFNNTTSKSLIASTKSMLEYAKSIGCSRLVAYTSVPSIARYITTLGGHADYTFLTLPTSVENSL